jgi:signal transduction histidine kinase
LSTPIRVIPASRTPWGVVDRLSRRDARAAAPPYAPHVIASLALRRRPGSRFDIRDWILALVMLAVTLVGSIGEANARLNASGEPVSTGGHPAVPNASWVVFVLVAIAAVSLAWRRRFPLAVLGVSLVCVSTYSLIGYVNGTALLDVMVALYTVATLMSSRSALLAGLATSICLLVATAVHNPFGALGGGEILIPAEIVAAVSIGIAVGNRRAYLRAVEARADQAERTREEEAARRVDAERLRIARELHDAVAHTLSMINVQAGAAAHVAHDHPEQAARALEAIRLASKEGLREMRSIVNVLRQSDEAEATQPAPGLDMLDELLATTNRAGLTTTLRVDGTPRRLAATVDLAAYRIIQESLTNTIRHAGPASATVSLAWADDRLTLEIRDNGRGASANGGAPDVALRGAGHGLVGMRERAMAVGGTFETGSPSDGGFVVHAELPLDAEP